jgi:GNAT superfamily N-acetyltransferase
MKLRQATLADIDAMHRIRMSVVENRLRDPSRVTAVHYREMLDNSRGRGWVALDEREVIIGFAIADAVNRSVWALFVMPGNEGCGIGRKLHNVMVDWLFEQASTPLWLSTDSGTRAARFYAAAGWSPDGTTSDGEQRFTLRRDQR